jgi:hypothetical protein
MGSNPTPSATNPQELQRTGMRADRLGEARHHHRVQGVGLRQVAGGFGDVMYLARIDDPHRQVSQRQGGLPIFTRYADCPQSFRLA